MKRRTILLVAAFAAWAAPVLADEAKMPDPVEEEARSRYRRGLELFDEGDYRLALVELERAYSIAASFKILYNIGQIHYQLAEYARAATALDRYLREGGAEIPAARRAEVEKDLAALKRRTATLTVRTNASGASVAVDDVPVGQGPTLVDAGVRRVSASKPGYEPRVVVLTLAGGDDRVVDVALRPIETKVIVAPSQGISGLAVAGWVATGVLAAGAIGTGIATSTNASRYETNRGTPIQGSPEEAEAELRRERNTVNALAITTDALIAAAVVAGGVSLYLTLRHPKADSPRVNVHGRGASFTIGF